MIVFSLNLRSSKGVRCKHYKPKRYFNKLKYCYNDNACYGGVYGDGLAGMEGRYGVCTAHPSTPNYPESLITLYEFCTYMYSFQKNALS